MKLESGLEERYLNRELHLTRSYTAKILILVMAEFGSRKNNSTDIVIKNSPKIPL